MNLNTKRVKRLILFFLVSLIKQTLINLNTKKKLGVKITYYNMSNTLGTIGTDNYKMKDCPFHLPKENHAFFTMMQ